MALRTATAEDWTRLTGLKVPAHWIGLVYEEDGEALGIGGLFEGADGRWWAAVKANARRPVALWRAAHEVLDVARVVGVAVCALPDPRIDGALSFLERLGFSATDETIEGHRILIWTP